MSVSRATAARSWRSAVVTLLGAIVLASLAAAQAPEIPPKLKAVVLGASKRPVSAVQINGTDFYAIGPFSSVPFLLWVQDPTTPLALPKETRTVGQWLARAGAELGHEDFEPAFREVRNWLGGEVWVYDLRRGGIPLFDAKVEVHWEEGGVVGLVNDVPGLFLSIEDPPASLPAGKEWTYWPERAAGGADLEIAWIEHESTPHGPGTFVVSRDGLELTRIAPPSLPPEGPESVFEEYPVPVGTFPDQIDLDSQGMVWFSQPLDDYVTRFHPGTLVFTQVATTGGSGPDGLIVDPFDRLWTGCYFSGHLGLLAPWAVGFQVFPMPYSPSAPAIPLFSRNKNVWITDHENNRISEWSPSSLTWVSSTVMPTPNCWVVAGAEDAARRTIYFTEYNANQLGKKPWIGPVTDIPTPGGGVAFDVFYKDKVYYSEWYADRLGVYDVVTGAIVEYTYPVANEVGGPITRTPAGLIVVGTRNLGYIMVFDPGSISFAAYQIPTPYPGLKDGITSDDSGIIWFTETGANKIARLKRP